MWTLLIIITLAGEGTFSNNPTVSNITATYPTKTACEEAENKLVSSLNQQLYSQKHTLSSSCSGADHGK